MFPTFCYFWRSNITKPRQNLTSLSNIEMTFEAQVARIYLSMLWKFQVSTSYTLCANPWYVQNIEYLAILAPKHLFFMDNVPWPQQILEKFYWFVHWTHLRHNNSSPTQSYIYGKNYWDKMGSKFTDFERFRFFTATEASFEISPWKSYGF